jgi:hypothetical protein
MQQKHLAFSLLMLGCTALQPISGNGTLILKPQVSAGRFAQTQINVYDQNSIDHLTLTLYTIQSGKTRRGYIPNASK